MKLKILIKVINKNRDLLRAIVGLKARATRCDNKFYEELKDEFRIVGIREFDETDESGDN